MSLLKSIQERQLQARKQRNGEDDAVRIALLTTLLGEAGAVGKNAGNRESTDAEVVAVVKKFCKNIDETLAAVGADSPKASSLRLERSVLEEFLPKQMAEPELQAVLQGLAVELGAAGPKDMGRLMKELKARYDGQYDGSSASALCKKVLSQG